MSMVLNGVLFFKVLTIFVVSQPFKLSDNGQKSFYVCCINLQGEIKKITKVHGDFLPLVLPIFTLHLIDCIIHQNSFTFLVCIITHNNNRFYNITILKQINFNISDQYIIIQLYIKYSFYLYMLHQFPKRKGDIFYFIVLTEYIF